MRSDHLQLMAPLLKVGSQLPELSWKILMNQQQPHADPMNRPHSPWPLFGDDLELARAWLRPQLRGVVSLRTGHLAINLGMGVPCSARWSALCKRPMRYASGAFGWPGCVEHIPTAICYRMGFSSTPRPRSPTAKAREFPLVFS